MAVRIGDVTIRIGASTKQLENDLRRAERSLQATADKFQTIGTNLTLGITAPLAIIGGASFKMASDFEESLNKVRVAFGESAGSVEEFAKTTITSIGLAEGSALEMASLFGDMATSMGLTRPAAAEMSKSLVTLAGDLASFKNIGIEEAQTALAGVFTGETESLKRLGIVMTEANVQAFALTQGITKKLQAMTQAEKVSLRYAYVMSVTKNAQGDFARTADGAANQMRTFQESVKQLGAQFGQVLLPVITPIIVKVNELISKFQGLDSGTKKIIVTIAAIAAAIGPIVLIFGKLQLAVGVLQIAWIKLTAVLASGGLQAAFAFLGGPVLVGLAATAAAVYLIYKNWEQVKKSLVDVINYFIDLYNESLVVRVAVQGIVLQFKQMYAAAKLAVNLIINSFATLFKFLIDGFKNAGALIEAVLTGEFGDIPGIITEAYKKGFTNIKELAQDTAEDFGDYFSDTGKNITDAIDNSLKKQKIKPVSLEATVTNIKTEVDAIKQPDLKIDGGTGRKTPIIAQLETTKKGVADLVPLFQNLQVKANKATVKKLSDSLAVAKPELNQTAAFLKQVGDEIEAIEVRSDRGFITQAEADIEKAERIKAAIQDATQQGLGTGVVDALQEQLKDISPQQTFGNIFEFLGDKISKIPNIADKLGENLQGLGPKISKALQGVANTIGQIFSTIGGVFDSQEEKLDAFEEKEKARIENSLMSEENKAAALDKLNEDVLKKRKILARKQAAIDKAQAIFSAIVSGANAVVQALTAGPIVGPLLAKITAGLVAAQIAAIAATPLPSLAIGTDMVKSDGMAMIHKGEAIVPANVARGGYTGGGQELYGRLSGLDIVVSNRNAQKYLNRIG